MPSDNLGIDLGSTGGSWLFKQGDLLLGPVQLPKLVELLNSGEVDENTLVAPFNLEPKFQPLGQVERFRVHLAKAKAKLRVEAQSNEQNRVLRRGRTLKVSGIGVLSLVLLLGGGGLASWLATTRPWEKRLEVLPEAQITDELPQIKLASARSEEIELAYQDPTRPAGARRPGKGKGPGAVAANQGGGATSPGAKGSGDDVDVVQQWDQEAINSVVRANKGTLHPCLSAEAARQKPGWETRIPIEFTIGNDGRISKLWIDNPDYKSEDTDLFRCMQASLKRWKFPSYEGEQANVSLAFRIQSQVR